MFSHMGIVEEDKLQTSSIHQNEQINESVLEVEVAVGMASSDMASFIPLEKEECKFETDPFGIPEENLSYVERSSILDKIAEFFGENNPRGENRTVALTGPEGIGKTQIMLRYTYLYRRTYGRLLWLNADNWNITLHDMVTAFADEEDKEEYMKTKKWLFLLDNADEIAAKRILEALPHKSGKVILTTRDPILSIKAKVIPVGTMCEEEGLNMLLGQELKTIDRQSARFRNALDILRELAYIPLAIEIARAYINNTGSSFQHYLFWEVALERIRETNPTGALILEVCVFLQSDSIPTTPTNSLNNSEIGKEIAQLTAFKLISVISNKTEMIVGERKNITLRICPLVQKIVYDKFKDRKRLDWIKKISNALYLETRDTRICDTESRSTMSIYLPHIRHFVTFLNTLDHNPPLPESLSSLLIHTVQYLFSNGIFNGAAKLAKLSVTVSELIYGNDHPETSTAIKNLAGFYECQGMYEQAEPLYHRVLAIKEKALGSEHPEIASSLYSLAKFFYNQGKYEQAEPQDKVLGAEHPYTANSMHCLGRLYCNQGKYDRAELLLQRAVEIREKVFGVDHPETAHTLYYLAKVYKSQNIFDKAEYHYRRSLAIEESVLGPEHPDTAAALHAKLYSKQGKTDQVIALFQQSLAICEKVLGPEHPDTLRSRDGLDKLL
ncbi:uncharacterized protein VTP21DRAFT_5861 [Calcarisporiella thermophila]|uniref:uncharacterized protein n=1 Tax=Calcarisporiella thermophila TaxID=911321 RepID=UPI00374327F8